MTQQLEIEFFFPLTEQINLPLDFTPCEEYQKSKSVYSDVILGSSNYIIASSGLSNAVTTSFEINRTSKSAGSYSINGTSFRLYMEKEPNFIQKWCNKVLLNNIWQSK